jgi:tryptophanyl-tRNA synthetase
VTTSVLSCIQPTSEIHIGNYFGAIKNWVELQEQYKCAFGVVDLHAMTVPFVPAQLRRNTEDMVVSLLACGIDPARALVFVQSLVPEHTELAWILGCVCSYGELSRMTQFKDKRDMIEEAQGDTFVSAGLFTYPILMAADILIYRSEYVPVGRDQVQHLELARDIARRFNERFQLPYFPEPKPLLTEAPKIMSLADPTKKMSKSLGPKHYIGLFDDRQTVEAKVMSAVTDTGPSTDEMSPGVANLFAILNASDSAATEQLRHQYSGGTLKYRDLKGAVVDAVSALTSRLRTRRDELLHGSRDSMEIARNCSNQARLHARNTVTEVRAIVGLPEMSINQG